MNKTDMMAFAYHAKTGDDMIAELTQKKIQEFIEYEKIFFEKFDKLMEDLFPAEVIAICKDYINTNHRVITVGDLWIDILYEKEVRVRLNPNKYKDVAYLHGIGHLRTLLPQDINQLMSCAEVFENNVLLAKTLEEKIEEVYDFLCNWKTKQCNDTLGFLNNISFGIPQSEKKYKVTIIVEEVG